MEEEDIELDTPREAIADLPAFTFKMAHLLLRGVYGDSPHHNDGSHLDRGVADNALYKSHWHQLAAQ